jgi:hypothetical protein
MRLFVGDDDEELEQPGGGVHCSLGHLMRVRVYRRPPHGEFARRYSPPEAGWEVE